LFVNDYKNKVTIDEERNASLRNTLDWAQNPLSFILTWADVSVPFRANRQYRKNEFGQEIIDWTVVEIGSSLSGKSVNEAVYVAAMNLTPENIRAVKEFIVEALTVYQDSYGFIKSDITNVTFDENCRYEGHVPIRGVARWSKPLAKRACKGRRSERAACGGHC
jgi:hypothetical protein